MLQTFPYNPYCKTLQETLVPAAKVGDNLLELTINGSMAEMEHHITAYLEQENEDGETEAVTVGQLNIASYIFLHRTTKIMY